MKFLGLLGGMSWQSSALYEKYLNEGVNARLGGQHSSNHITRSVDFAEIEACQIAGDWDKAEKILVDAALGLKRAGVDAIVLCTNTMHRIAPGLEKATGLPLIHIADATATKITKLGLGKPLLLATRYTMEQDFYKGRLQAKHGIDVKIPDEKDRIIVHDIIFNELCHGVISLESKERYLAIIEKNRADIDSVILGCTEIGMLIEQQDLSMLVLDTTRIHAEAALDFAFGTMPSPTALPLLRRAGVA